MLGLAAAAPWSIACIVCSLDKLLQQPPQDNSCSTMQGCVLPRQSFKSFGDCLRLHDLCDKQSETEMSIQRSTIAYHKILMAQKQKQAIMKEIMFDFIFYAREGVSCLMVFLISCPFRTKPEAVDVTFAGKTLCGPLSTTLL